MDALEGDAFRMSRRPGGVIQSTIGIHAPYIYIEKSPLKKTPAAIDVVGVGLNATDTVIPVSHFPASGSKVEVRSASVLPGGQVATAMVACRRWGLRARYVGKLGDDHAASLHRSAFDEAGVEARLLTAPGCTSQQAFILVEDSGERTVLWKRDPRLTLLPEDLRKEWITDARVVHLDGHDTEAAILAATWARAAGIPVVADLDELYPGVERLIEKIDYLIVSRDIPEQLTGSSDLFHSLPQIQKQFGCRLTAATLGHDGVVAWDTHAFCYRPAWRVNVVDTTGAGDIFHAGFIYGLSQQWPLEQTLDFACAAAALNCTASGARGGIRELADVEKLMAAGSRYETKALPDISLNHPSAHDPILVR
jgi:sugar/nucleoside kinase (ribokinase family)